MLKGVIFDMDGVLVNSEPLHYKAYYMVMEELGYEYPYQEYKRFIGSTNEKIIEDIKRKYNIALTYEEFLRKVNKNKKFLLSVNGYERIEGIPALLGSLSEAGLTLGVASSSPEKTIFSITASFDIQKYFKKLISGEHVKDPKPAPDVFLKAMKELGLKPEECIIIEDSTNGIKAAKAAGVTCIGYANPDSGNQDLSEAFYVVEGFEEIDYDFILKVYQRSKGLPWKIAETERLILRELTLEDMDDLYEVYAEPGVTEYLENLYEDREKEKEFTEAYIKNMYGFFEYGLWAVIEKSSGKLIGRVGLSNREIDGNLEIELGYVIGGPYQRKGYGLEACQASLSYAVSKFKPSKINCFIQKGNMPSVKLAEKLGFSFIEEAGISEPEQRPLLRYLLQCQEE